MTELKPCPFCNGFASIINVEFNDGDVWYRPECSECKCGWQENYESIGEAVNVWNLRAEGRGMTNNMAIEALQDQTTIRKMAEFISHMDIDEQICKKMPTVEAKECNDCQYRSYRGTDIDSCRECVVFYEDDCAYGDCVNCIIEFFRRDEE